MPHGPPASTVLSELSDALAAAVEGAAASIVPVNALAVRAGILPL